MKKLVLILGMHRSGTSAVAAGFHFAGLHGGELLKSHYDNSKGYYENKKVVNLNDRILAATGGSWDNPFYFMNDDFKRSVLASFGREADEILENEFGPSENIYLKDPRLSYTLPFWLGVIRRADKDVNISVVHVVRNPYQVFQSLANRFRVEPERNVIGLNMNACFTLWANYNAQGRYFTRDIEHQFFMAFDDIFTDGNIFVHDICNKLGMTIDAEGMERYAESFLDRKMVHSGKFVDLEQFVVYGFSLKVLQHCFLNRTPKSLMAIIEDLVGRIAAVSPAATVVNGLLNITKEAVKSLGKS